MMVGPKRASEAYQPGKTAAADASAMSNEIPMRTGQSADGGGGAVGLDTFSHTPGRTLSRRRQPTMPSLGC